MSIKIYIYQDKKASCTLVCIANLPPSQRGKFNLNFQVIFEIHVLPKNKKSNKFSNLQIKEPQVKKLCEPSKAYNVIDICHHDNCDPSHAQSSSKKMNKLEVISKCFSVQEWSSFLIILAQNGSRIDTLRMLIKVFVAIIF